MKENKEAIFSIQRKLNHLEDTVLHLMEKVDILERKAEGKGPRAHRVPDPGEEGGGDEEG
jgi:hypothetical protein